MNLDALAIRSTRAALSLRRECGIALDASVCPFDVAEALGIDVRLVAGGSLEGLYVAEPREGIFIGAERPSGRRRLTCAHEIGHRVLGHGTRLDELRDDESDAFDPIEYSADRFALALLLPQTAVAAALRRRAIAAPTAAAEQLFVVSQSFGVGWRTLLNYFEGTLQIIRAERARALRRATPLQLRTRLSTDATAETDLFVVDQHWGARPVDVEINDTILAAGAAVVPSEPGAAPPIIEVAPGRWRALRPGSAGFRVPGLGTSLRVRVARRGFTGIAAYRHWETSDDDE